MSNGNFVSIGNNGNNGNNGNKWKRCCTVSPWTTLGLHRIGPLMCRYSSVVNSAVLYYPRLVEPSSTEAELRILSP